ncbi:MAG: hypothetical protein AAGA85_23985 [Bacteroidota bacterium]
MRSTRYLVIFWFVASVDRVGAQDDPQVMVQISNVALAKALDGESNEVRHAMMRNLSQSLFDSQAPP